MTQVVVIVDIANVMGSRPDGWWRDRAGAATRLLATLAPLAGAQVALPDGASGTIARLIAVLEGRARAATAPSDAAGLAVRHAPADGDTTVVGAAYEVLAGDDVPLVVTADRGLRERLPAQALRTGPGWLLALLEK